MHFVDVLFVSLHPTMTMINAYVSAKSPVSKFSSGQGKLVRMELKDAENKLLGLVAFNALADKWFSLLSVGKWYKISAFRLKANSLSGVLELHVTDETTLAAGKVHDQECRGLLH